MWAEHHDHVRPEWLDGNGHMNLAYYVLVFDRGTDAWLDLAGLGAAYRARGPQRVRGGGAHKLSAGGPAGASLAVRTPPRAAEGKRIHLLHEMTSEGAEVAMQEVLFLHVDLRTRRRWRLGDAAEAGAGPGTAAGGRRRPGSGAVSDRPVEAALTLGVRVRANRESSTTCPALPAETSRRPAGGPVLTAGPCCCSAPVVRRHGLGRECGSGCLGRALASGMLVAAALLMRADWRGPVALGGRPAALSRCRA